MRIFPLSMTIFSLFAFATPSLAGVVVKSKDGSVSYFSSGKMKNVPAHGDAVTIFNVNDNTMTIINPKDRTYTTATVKQFCQATKAMKDEAMGQLSPEQRQMMQQFLGQHKNTKPPKVTIKNLGSGGEIAGYPTSKYLVMADGKKHEELYLAERGFPVSREINLDKFWNFSEEFTQCTTEGLGMGDVKIVETDPAFQKLMRRGFPLKTVDFENGRPDDVDQVVSVKKQSLSDAEFKAPPGYKKVDVRGFYEQEQRSSMESSHGSYDSSSYAMPPEMNEPEQNSYQSPAPSEEPAMHAGDSAPPAGFKEGAARSLNGVKDKLKQGFKSLFGN